MDVEVEAPTEHGARALTRPFIPNYLTTFTRN